MTTSKEWEDAYDYLKSLATSPNFPDRYTFLINLPRWKQEYHDDPYATVEWFLDDRLKSLMRLNDDSAFIIC